MSERTDRVSRWIQRLVVELSWTAAVLVGWRVAQDRLGSAGLYPVSGGYREYLCTTNFMFHPERCHVYNDWRRPAWGWLVGAWAHLMDLPHWVAGFSLSQASTFVLILGSAALARAAAGWPAAVVVALSAPLFPWVPATLRWLDPYGMEAAVAAVVLAAGVAWARTGHALCALALGAACGLGLALDARELSIVIAGALLLVLGLRRAVPNVLAAVVAVGLAAAGPAAHAYLVDRFHVPQADFATIVAEQHGHLAMIVEEGVRMKEQCTAARGEEVSLGALFSPCAGVAREVSLGRLAAGAVPFVPYILAFVTLLVVGSGWRWSRTASLLAFGIPSAALLFTVSWVVVFPRYMGIYLPVIVSMGPVAGAAAVGWVWRRWRLWPLAEAAVVLIVGAAWVAWVAPGALRSLPAPDVTPHAPEDPELFLLAEHLWTEARPGDILLDCSVWGLGGLVPDQVTYQRPRDPATLTHTGTCLDARNDADWLVTSRPVPPMSGWRVVRRTGGAETFLFGRIAR